MKPKINGGFGSVAVPAADAHEALHILKGMMERGVKEVEILDDSGTRYDVVQLYHIARRRSDMPHAIAVASISPVG